MIFLIAYRQSHRDWVEIYYSKGLYPQITRVISSLSDLIPFSLTEWALIALIGLTIYQITHVLISVFKGKSKFLNSLKRLLKGTFILVSFTITLFYLSWGINYFRVPLKNRIPFDQSKVNKANLYRTLDKLISRANQLVDSKEPDFDTMNQIINKAISSVIKEIDGTKVYDYTAKRSKTLVFNVVMEKALVSGFASPFFHEIHYDSKLFPQEIPFTLAHEKAHLNGYTGEGEANFIGYLACMRSGNAYSEYSALVSVISHFLFQVLKYKKRDRYNEFRNRLDPKILKLYEAMSLRYRKNRGVFSRLQSKVYDKYLKINKINKGVKDYSEVVTFILSYQQPSN
ncbi:MAG: zinc-binding protein [bacterium]|nr:MAG: zinc-binding protein [bacterium]